MRKGESVSLEAAELQEKKPTVLSLSEMALYAKYPDGRKDKIAEVGNSNYRFNPKLIEFFPDVGLLVNFGRRQYEFPTDTLFTVPHHLGFVSAEAMFGKEEGVWSESDFELRLYEFCHLTEDKLKVLISFAKAAGWRVDDIQFSYGLIERIQRFIQREAREKKEKPNLYPSPEEVVRKSVDVILGGNFFTFADSAADSDEVDLKKKMFERLKNDKFVEAANQKEFEEATVGLFYVWARFKDFDLSAHPEQTKKAVEKYPFARELIAQYRRSTGPDWGDFLLGACSEIWQEWEEQDEKERQKDQE